MVTIHYNAFYHTPTQMCEPGLLRRHFARRLQEDVRGRFCHPRDSGLNCRRNGVCQTLSDLIWLTAAPTGCRERFGSCSGLPRVTFGIHCHFERAGASGGRRDAFEQPPTTSPFLGSHLALLAPPSCALSVLALGIFINQVLRT